MQEPKPKQKRNPQRENKARAFSFEPVADRRAKILILGTLPSVASLKAGQYYAHPRNHFWPIMGALIGAGPDVPYPERLRRLRAAGIALWDVVASAERRGSGDAAIRKEVPNDVPGLLERCRGIRKIFFNGAPAERLFRRHFPEMRKSDRWTYFVLPSTSPAHARRSFAEKLAAWRPILGSAE